MTSLALSSSLQMNPALATIGLSPRQPMLVLGRFMTPKSHNSITALIKSSVFAVVDFFFPHYLIAISIGRRFEKAVLHGRIGNPGISALCSFSLFRW